MRLGQEEIAAPHWRLARSGADAGELCCTSVFEQ